MYKLRIDLGDFPRGQTKIDVVGHVSSLAPRRVPRDRQPDLLLAEYAKRGEACFADLEGSFAIVVRTPDCVQIVADRVGSRKIYYYSSPDRREIWVSDSLAGLVAMGVPKVFDRRSLYEFCATWYVQGNRTILDGVRVVRAAHVLTIDAQGATERPYWEPIVEGYPNPEPSLDSLVEEFHSIWSEEIERLSQLAERFVVPLSGGLDGRLILSSLLERVSPSRVLTYTFGIPGTYDYELGRAAASAFGCENTAVPVIERPMREQFDFAIEEFEGQIKCVPSCPLPFSRFVETDARTVLSGYGGDAVGGSWTKRRNHGRKVCDPIEMSKILESLHLRTDAARAAAVFGLSREETAARDVFPAPMHSPYVSDNIERHYYESRAANFLSYVLFTERDAFDYHLPIVSRRVFDFCLKIPARQKLQGRFFYGYMRKHHPRLASIPTKSYWGLPLNASPLRLALGIVRRKGRNVLNRQALRLLNCPLWQDPYENYIDEFDLYRRDAEFRAMVRDCLVALRERAFVDRAEVEKVVDEAGKMTPRLMALVSYLAQIECVAQWYDALPARRSSVVRAEGDTVDRA
ncbi:hypothetical protein JW916_05110 [Candidatus Sumerlaeota bacterium]|nr:hypothetical protein [Candidatus Sumerlaeota bacterium]